MIYIFYTPPQRFVILMSILHFHVYLFAVIIMFTKVFDNSDIVKQWKERGFEHIGTIFLGNDYDIALDNTNTKNNFFITKHSFYYERKITIKTRHLLC